MTITEQIIQHLAGLSEREQDEVLDFIEYLTTRSRERRQQRETEEWAAFSLNSAMRGLEDDPIEYTAADLKETF